MPKTYTKQEAADYLKVSTRAVERYVAKGKLSPSYTRGATGQIATFKEADLRRLKAEMSAPPPPVKKEAPRPTGADTAIARRGPSDLGALLAAMRESAAAALARQAHPTVPLSEKMMLSLAEASELSGVSRGVIERAVKGGELKASKVGHRGARVIKRADLEAWVRKL